jgi:mono/diheme cytochrome c family protein
MAVGKNFGLSLFAGAAMFGVAVFTTPMSAQQAAPAAAPEVTFTKDIAPILQRSCQNCHRPGQVAPDVAPDLRGREAVGALDEGAHRDSRQGRRDAAVVHREEHRHSALQERSVAER